MLDVDRLLKPITEGAPSGPDLRLSAAEATLATIQELRAERTADLTGEAKEPNWPAVLRACEEVLATRSKDLEVAAWLAEATVHSEGFPGLEVGLRLMTELIRGYWGSLHPGLEGGEIVPEIRAKPLSWLGREQFLRTIKRVPLVGEAGGKHGWLDFEISHQVDLAASSQSPERYEDMLAQGFLTGDQWRAALGATPAELLRQSFQDIRGAEAQLRTLEQVCTEKFGADEMPDLIALRDLVAEISEFLARNTTPEGAASGDATQEVSRRAAAPATGSTGPVSSRSQALARLAEVADYFRRAEPHSPISYLVQRAVRWGQMPLEDLLAEIVKDGVALESIRETLGIKRSDTASAVEP